MKISKFRYQVVGVVMMVLCSGGALWAGNLVKNGDFSQGGGESPVGWKVMTPGHKISTEKPEDKPGALKVEVVKEASKSLGEIKQEVKIKKNTKYRISAEMKSSKARVGLVMAKPIADKKEAARINVGESKTEWTKVSKDFDSGEATSVQLLCRFSQKADMVGANCLFTNIELVELDAAGQPVDGGTAKATDAKKGEATTQAEKK